MKDIRLGLTFNDVLLVPKRTPLSSRSEAEVTSRFTKNIALNIPLVSANMATVTEHKMAIAMAREGGLGVIHQFGSIEEQMEEIKKVKRVIAKAMPETESSAAAAHEVRLVLGDKVRFEGFGLKTRIEGAVTAYEEPGRPTSAN